MRAHGNTTTGGPGDVDTLGLPTEEREDREAARARIEAQRERLRSQSPFAAQRAAEASAPRQERHAAPASVTTSSPARVRSVPTLAPHATGPGAEVMGLQRVPVIALVDDPHNPRDSLGDVVSLAASIAQQGLLQPIVVRTTDEGDLMILAGHRRAAAIRSLGWSQVDVIVRKAMAPDAVLAAQLVENGQRANLDPIEEARALARLKALGDLTDAAVAQQVGLAQPRVSGRLALLSLSPEEQEEVRAGHMKLTEAIYKARLASGKVRAKGARRSWHFGPDHDLAHLAKARCLRLKHPRSSTVGAVACGACWESVIRADDRQHQHAQSAKVGACTLCGTQLDREGRAR